MPRRKAVDKYEGPMNRGLDVSKWQGEINWEEVATAGLVDFVFVRTGDGVSRDSRFEENVMGAEDNGLVVGSYHYFRADRDGKTQAALVSEMITDILGGYAHALPPVLDLEEGGRKNLRGGVFESTEKDMPIDLVVEESLEYLETLERTLGVRPMVYTGQAFHWWLSQGRPDLAVHFEKYPLWIPSYGKPHPKLPVDQNGQGFPWKEWTFWQYTASGEVPGIQGPCDLNYFRGSHSDLDTFAKESWNAKCRPAKDEYEEHLRRVEEVSSALKERRASLLRVLEEVSDAIADLISNLNELDVK